MAKKETTPEEKFRDAWADDAPGLMFRELSTAHAMMAQQQVEIGQIKAALRVIDPKAIQLLENNELLRLLELRTRPPAPKEAKE